MKNTRDAYRFVLKLLALSAILVLTSVLFRRYFSDNTSDEVFGEASAKYTVVIDAGHGGVDSGASEGGIAEKDLNLQISGTVSDFLEIFDVDVAFTRTDDRLLADENLGSMKRQDLLNRVKIAKQYDEPIFVSIHMNRFSDGRYKGLQVFHSRNNPYSEALALKLQGNNKRFLEPDNERAVKSADSSIYVLDRLECPAVLIECGFMSNASDLEKLCNRDYQQKLSFVIVGSIMEYLLL